MQQKYIVRLTAPEREELAGLTGCSPVDLLFADRGRPFDPHWVGTR
jgi:hypothetical protein